jgi:dUTP pyrophosphatase
MIPIKIKRLSNASTIPSWGSQGAACFDLYSAQTTSIKPGETKAIPTDLAFEIPVGYSMKVYSRSGCAFSGLVIANSPGIIDSDYRGNLMLMLHNNTNVTQQIIQGRRYAQGELTKCEYTTFELVDELSETERNNGGFGSTGK